MKKRVLVVCLVLMAGCGSQGAGPAAPSSGIEGEWWLVAGHGSGGTVRVSEPSDATMTIAGSKISGSAVCNSYSGRADVDGSAFRASDLSVTEMACMEPWRGRSEHAFLSALTAATEIVRHGDQLTLTGPSTELRFRVHRQPPTPRLAGTRWHLSALLQGKGSSGMASSVDPASLVLQDDGTLVGTTGCQRFTGTWTVAGDEVHVDRFRTEGGCTPAVDQDARIVEVLSGGFSFVIREQSLDLYELGSDSGLSYTTGLR